MFLLWFLPSGHILQDSSDQENLPVSAPLCFEITANLQNFTVLRFEFIVLVFKNVFHIICDSVLFHTF